MFIPVSGAPPTPATATKKINRKAQAARILVILILAGIAYKNLMDRFPPPETPGEQFKRWRQAALHDMLESCTNQIVGLNRFIDIQFMDYDFAVSNWTGEVVLEYVNKNGGIERTNLSFRFALHVDGIGESIWTNAGLDYKWMAEQRAKQRQAEFDEELRRLRAPRDPDASN